MKANLKILILEDNQNDADLLLPELKRSGINFISEIVQTREEFENALQNFSPDIILADYSLPSFDGLTAFNIKQNTSPDIPFIIVSGVIGEENAVELIRNGVTDFALKDKLFALIPKINRALKEAKEKKEKRIADEELVFQNEEKEKLAAKQIIANKELEKAEEQFRLIVESVPNAMVLVNNEGFITLVNNQTEKLFGYERNELIGNKLEILIPERFRKQHPDQRNMFFKKPEMRSMGASRDIFAMRKNGTEIQVEIGLNPIETAKGHMVLAAIIDITERKIQEATQKKYIEVLFFQNEEKEKLAAELIIANKKLAFQNEESEEQFEAIFNDAPMGIAIIDSLTGNIFNVNPKFAKIAGRTIAEMVNIDWTGITHPDDIQLELNKMAQLLAGEINGFRMEKRYIHPDGSFVWINMTISKILYHNKSHPRHLCMIEDITESKKVEQAIKESEEKFRTLVQQAADGIFIVDQEGNYQEANGSAAKLTGYSIDELKKMNASELIPTEELKKNPLKLEVIKKRGPVIIERVIRRKDKTLINVEVSAKLMDNGKVIVILRDITERIKAQNEIFKEKNLSDSIINSLPGIFYLFNMEGKFLRWNKNFETESKYSAKEIREMHPLDFFDEDEKELVSRKIKNVFISGKENVQANFLLKTKEKIPYYFTGIALSYEGSPCLLGVGIDFSELKKTQQALAENENRLRVILQATPECIKLVGINGELEEMNPAGLAMIEADSFEQIIGKSLFDVIDKPYRKAFSQLTQNVFKGKSGKLEFEITGLKGTHSTLETHAVPLKDAEGKILSLLCITRDITEHKKTEKEILRAIERYDMIAKATSDTIWDWDITSDKIFYNEGLVNMFGYEKTNIEDIPAWWKSKIHPDDLQIVLEAVAAAYKKQSYNLQLEYRFRCADESFKYIYDRAFVIYDEHKKPCRMIGAMQDVSQLKENEISLNELNKNLQKQAKELSISNEELEQFAYMVSHDLQEPLRMVTSFLTQLNRKYEDVIDDKGKKYIFFAVDGAKRMRKIILDLLEFSRVGRTEDIQKKLDLNEIIDEIKILFRKKIEEKSAIIQVGQLPVINAHKAPILQVFQNLISNAFKYSREDIPAQIHITAKELENHWQFAVADNGIGISEEYFDKIFVIFQRLHNKDEYSGTGIGLAVTKKIIESQNGKIWVESEEGKGSIFYFTIKKTDK